MARNARKRWLAAIALALGCVSVLRAQEKPEYVWIEGETPSFANFPVTPVPQHPELLSGGAWLAKMLNKDQIAKGMPADGFDLKYDFDAPSGGGYEVWGRIGWEWVRSPIDWRIDGGAWSVFTNTTLTTSLVGLATWNELAWGRFGEVVLQPGKHTLELRATQPGADGRMMFGVDCLALIKGRGWVPELKLKPGETYDAPVDKEAGAHVFAFAGGALKPAPERCELSLTGLWQVARYDDPEMQKDPYEPVKAIPAPAAYPLRWMGIEVPGDAFAQRAELLLAHRMFFRTRVNVPADFKGRSFLLHFSGTCYIASVFVNGEYIGGRQSVLVPWDIDITKGVVPGRENTLVIGIKSPWYAVETLHDPSSTTLDRTRNTPRTFLRYAKVADGITPSTKGEGDGTQVGLVFPLKLVVAGPAFASDVYVRTRVADRRLDADVEVTNPTAAPLDLEVQCAAVHDRSGQTEKTFDPVKLSVPAGQTAVAKVGGAWPDAKLWWPAESPADLPDCYQLRTTLLSGGKPLDVRQDLFGFREIAIRGRDFVLNGIPWHFYNWVDVEGTANPQEWEKGYHAEHDRFHRFSWDQSHRFGCREEAVEWLDRHGIPNRCSTCIDGMFISHNPRDPQMWKNFQNHLEQVARAYRNHPSLMHWSIGNEFMLVTVRNVYMRDYDTFENDMVKLGQAVEALDPTRSWYEDGAGDCANQGPVCNVHYSWSGLKDVPRELYEYPTGPAVLPRPQAKTRENLYLWDGKRPWVGGEEFYYAGSRMAWFGGPSVYRGKAYANEAAAKYVRMAVEGARWQDAGGICPWTVPPTPDAIKCMAPRAVFVREHNRCFYPGATCTRTIAVFNDGRATDPLTLKWKIVMGGKEVAGAEKTYTVPPGGQQRDTLSAILPKAGSRLDGELQLELYAGGQKVFEDAKALSVLPAPGGAAVLDPGALCVFDPDGAVAARLTAVGQGFTKLDALPALPSAARVLIVGRNALPEDAAKTIAPVLRAFVTQGNTAIVLEQNFPLQKQALPVSDVFVAGEKKDQPAMAEFQRQGGRMGAICHPVAPAHPVLAGLQPDDFFTWADGETNYRLSYATPAAGAVGLIQAGDELSLSPMMEIPIGAGAYLLSQVLVGEKLGKEPVADALLQNMLRWAAGRLNAKPGKTVAFTAGDADLAGFLGTLGLALDTADSAPAALNGDARVAVLRGKPEVVQWLADNPAAVKAFCASGRWIMIARLDRPALKAFEAVVGVPHRLRDFRAEAVHLDNVQDPLLLGLSDRDVTQYSHELIAPWAGIHGMSARVFTSVVDAGPQIASFLSGVPPRMTDGLRMEDFWKYTQYVAVSNGVSSALEFTLDRPETLTGMKLWTSDAYFRPKEVEVTLDGDTAGARKYALTQGDDEQDLAFSPKPASKIALQILSCYPSTKGKDLATIDEIEVFRAMPEGVAQRVEPLSEPAGLVKYPVGSGGIVLNQVDYTEKVEAAATKTAKESTELKKSQEANVAKKRTIFSALLRNMGASFEAAAPAPAPAAAPRKPGGRKPRE